MRHAASSRGHIVALILERAGHVVAEVAAEFGGEEAQQSPKDAVAAPHAQVPPEERLAPRDGDRLFQPCGFGPRDVLAERREDVGSPPLVFSRGVHRGFANQAFGQKALDDAVERSGAQPDRSGGEVFDLLHDGVPMCIAVGERDEHVEHRRREGEGGPRDRVSYDARRYVVARHMSTGGVPGREEVRR